MPQFGFENTHPYDVDIDDILSAIDCSSKLYQELCRIVESSGRSDAIHYGFKHVLDSTTANPTVLWNGVLRAAYVNTIQDRTLQSWRSASGRGFEKFLSSYYTNLLPDSLRVMDHTDTEKQEIVETVGIANQVGKSKVDLTIQNKREGEWYIIGHIAAKTSLRERLSEDQQASKSFIESKLLSVALTLDAQYELGSPSNITENRSLIEERKAFHYLYSFNQRTTESVHSGLYSVQRCGPQETTDAFSTVIQQFVDDHDKKRLERYPRR